MPKNVFNVILSPWLFAVLLFRVPLHADSSIGFFVSKIKAFKSPSPQNRCFLGLHPEMFELACGRDASETLWKKPVWLFITGLQQHFQRKQRENVDFMRVVVFKDVLHMKSPGGNHPDVVCSGPHQGHAAGHRSLELTIYLRTSHILLMIQGVLIATIAQNAFHAEL